MALISSPITVIDGFLIVATNSFNMDIPLSDLESTARDIVRRQMLDEELEYVEHPMTWMCLTSGWQLIEIMALTGVLFPPGLLQRETFAKKSSNTSTWIPERFLSRSTNTL